jgi:hypothetical protein
MVTGGSHNSSGWILSNVSDLLAESPGEQASQRCVGSVGFPFGFGTYMKQGKTINIQYL